MLYEVITTATTSVDPDLLVITFGVETQEKSAKDALVANSESMTSIVNTLRSLGVSEDDISTSRISIYPIYDSYSVITSYSIHYTKLYENIHKNDRQI